MVLAAATGTVTQIIVPPPAVAMTTTLVGDAVPPAILECFCFLVSVGWDLGAYHEVNSSDFVAVPARLIVDVCGVDPLD